MLSPSYLILFQIGVEKNIHWLVNDLVKWKAKNSIAHWKLQKLSISD